MSLEGFELFKKSAVPVTNRAAVTLQRGGLLSINAAAYQKLGSPEAFEAFYNSEENKIALRPASFDSPYALPNRKQGAQRTNNPTNIVSLRAFCSYHDIDTSTARRYRPEITDDGLLIVDLNQEGIDVTGPRARDGAKA